jgi:hypothetical protein
MNSFDQTSPHLGGPPRRRAGRPTKNEGPRVNYAELDHLIVFGEPGNDPAEPVRYPSYRELAARYGVAVSVIGEYGRKHKCQKRRKAAARRIRALVDQKMSELHADARANGAPEPTRSAAQVLRDSRRTVAGEMIGAAV